MRSRVAAGRNASRSWILPWLLGAAVGVGEARGLFGRATMMLAKLESRFRC